MHPLEILWPTACAGCDVPHCGWLCPDCLACFGAQPVDVRLPGIRATLATASYASPVGVALQRAKYGKDRSLMKRLARQFADTLAPCVLGASFEAIVDVPSPWTRRAVRGFATGALLAAELSARTRIPVRHAIRIRPGPRNAGLNVSGRRRNLVGRIRSKRPVEGRVLLVDDVVTTGATAMACARELLGTASREVWLLTLCSADVPARNPV